MDLYYIVLLIIASVLTIKKEENSKRRILFIGIYVVLIGIAIAYWMGFTIGDFIYNITNP
jgi:hypothetical protein